MVLLHCFDRFEITSKFVQAITYHLLLLTKKTYHLLNLVYYVVLFSSCLEWRCTYPLLEEAGLEVWAIDVLGWGFSDLGPFTCLFYC